MIPEFTDSELLQIREILNLRYRQEVEIQLSHCELVPAADPGSGVMCPTVFWHADNSNFVVSKAGMFRFRARFFYTPHEQHDTEIEEFADLSECVTALIESQSSHQRNQQSSSTDTSTPDSS